MVETMRTYVSTLGYHAERVTRPVLKHGLDAGDEVVLVRPDDEDEQGRASEAVDHVRRFLREVESEVSIAVERVETGDFEAAVTTCSDLLRAAEGELVVNLAGGAREVFLPLTVATIVHAPRVETALQFTDVDADVREWPVPDLTVGIPSSDRSTLAEIANAKGAVSIPELTEQSESSKSTVSRHVADLEQRGLVETWMEDRTKFAEVTITGTLLLRAESSQK